MKKNIFIIIYLNLFIVNGAAFAHPDSGFLPDAIAETEYRIVIDLNPDDIETRNRLGIVLYRKNMLKEALEQFNAVLKLEPDNFNAHDGIGLIKMKQEQYEHAVMWFRKAVALNGADAMVHYHLGLASKALKDYSGAVAELKKALKIKENIEISQELRKLEQLLSDKR